MLGEIDWINDSPNLVFLAFFHINQMQAVDVNIVAMTAVVAARIMYFELFLPPAPNYACHRVHFWLQIMYIQQVFVHVS